MLDSDDGPISVFEQNQSPVVTTLKDHAHIWRKEGATKFQVRIIDKGLKLDLLSTPSFYKEKNNKSFLEEQDFGLDAIKKLLDNKIILECE